MKRPLGIDQSFLGGPSESRGRVIPLMLIFTVAGISVGMGIDMKHNQVRIPLVQRPKLGQCDQTIAPHGHRHCTCRHYFGDRLLDIVQGWGDHAGRATHIAAVDYVELRQWIKIPLWRLVRPYQRGLFPNSRWAKSCANTGWMGTTVKWHSQHCCPTL